MKFIKNILFVSYLTHKGARRICFLLGFLPLLCCLFCFVVDGFKSWGVLLAGLAFFYFPFLFAVLITWIYRGFKDTTSVDSRKFNALLHVAEVISHPDCEFDACLDGTDICHIYARNYMDGKDVALVCVALNKNGQLIDAQIYNKTTEMHMIHNLDALIIEGTFIDYTKQMEESGKKGGDRRKNNAKK